MSYAPTAASLLTDTVTLSCAWLANWTGRTYLQEPWRYTA